MRTLSVSSRLGWTQASFWLELRFSLDFFWMAEKNEWIKLTQRASETRRRRPRRIAVTEAALSGKPWTARKRAAAVTAEKIEARL